MSLAFACRLGRHSLLPPPFVAAPSGAEADHGIRTAVPGIAPGGPATSYELPMDGEPNEPSPSTEEGRVGVTFIPKGGTDHGDV